MLFKLGYGLKRPMLLKYYKEFCLNNFKTNAELELQQCEALKRMISFCYDNVPYYQELFKTLGMTKNDFNSIEDLEKLPILSKLQIKKEIGKFWPNKFKQAYIDKSSGGSTGVPLKYRLSHECYERGFALHFRGFGFAGYNLGDKMAVVAGASLVAISDKEAIKKRIQDYVMNFHCYSSYGMDSKTLDGYFTDLNKWKPFYFYGYASSLFLLAKYISENNLVLKFHPKNIFSTSEVLLKQQREVIEHVFQTKVFDTYGVNDGGLSAFECCVHDGMHMDYERSIIQTVDDQGKVVTGQIGRIIGTSLYNYAMPFIRYETGDLGLIDADSSCACGCKRPLLKQVYGRTTDYLKLNEKIIGSPVLTVLMGKVSLENYQIVQVNSNTINIKYVNSLPLDSKDSIFIEKSFFEHVGPTKINFEKVKAENLLAKNKHKFIINEVCR